MKPTRLVSDCAALLVVFVMVLPACRRKPQPECDDWAERRCVDSTTMKACEKGTYRSYECHGPDGCVSTTEASGGRTVDRAECDQRVAKEGDACEDRGPTTACQDDRIYLLCQGGKFRAKRTCDGKQGCWRSVFAHCDVAADDPGASCADLDVASMTCSRDHQAALICGFPDRVWERAFMCHGGDCIDGKCAQAFGRAGESCLTGETDLCTEDGHDMLRCVDHRLSLAFSCRGPRGCMRAGFFDGTGTVAKAFCDQSVGNAGEACEPEGAPACSADATIVLKCKGGKLAASTDCPPNKRCMTVDQRVVCN